MVQKVIVSGNSLAVTIPNGFVKMMGIKKGDKVRVDKRLDRGQLILRFEGARQLSLSGQVLRKDPVSR